MKMMVNLIIYSVLFLVTYLLVLRYNLHMFQLNGYKNGEHLNRLKKSIYKQWQLVPCAVLSVLGSLTGLLAFNISAWVFLAVAAWVFNFYRTYNVKKKLVYTARVKRLIATHFVITAAVTLCFALFARHFLVTSWAVILLLQPLMQVICNIINKPAEKAVTNWYINDAKKMLAACPDLKIIGVTGSYGKTSVKFYLKTLLEAKYNVLATPESFNTPMGVVRTIREHLKSTDEIFICEMGARHVGDIKEICDIVHPHHGVITSIGPQHLETFFNMEHIKSTKFELADALPEGGKLFLNGDNEYINEKAVNYANKTFYYAAKEGSGYYAKDIKVGRLGTEFTVVTPEGEQESFSMRLIGGHNVINVVGAIAVAHSFGVALSDLRIPVRKLEPAAHRLQILERGAVTIIDDAYNSNPVGSKAAVETLAMFEGVRILVTPGMVELGDKEEEYNRLFGTYAAKFCDYILLVGKKRTEPIKEGALGEGFSSEKLQAFDTLGEAMTFAYGINDEGHKVILLENDLPDNY